MNMLKKIAQFLFETVFGPFVFWCAAALAFFTSIILASLLGKFGAALGDIALVALVVMSLVAVAAFFLALVRRQWRRAAGQFLLGIGCNDNYRTLLCFYSFLSLVNIKLHLI